MSTMSHTRSVEFTAHAVPNPGGSQLVYPARPPFNLHSTTHTGEKEIENKSEMRELYTH